MPLHPSNYCLAADCCACPQLPCFLHTSCPSRLSCCPHPSRLHRPVSDYLGILPCQHSLGCHPINPLSRLYPGEISSCLIINGNRQVQHHPCPSRNNFPLLSGLVWMLEAPPQSTKTENQAKYQKNCSKCTHSHQSCNFESPSNLQCTRCIKMHLLCFFKHSSESYNACSNSFLNLTHPMFILFIFFQNKAVAMICC